MNAGDDAVGAVDPPTKNVEQLARSGSDSPATSRPLPDPIGCRCAGLETWRSSGTDPLRQPLRFTARWRCLLPGGLRREVAQRGRHGVLWRGTGGRWRRRRRTARMTWAPWRRSTRRPIGRADHAAGTEHGAKNQRQHLKPARVAKRRAREQIVSPRVVCSQALVLGAVKPSARKARASRTLQVDLRHFAGRLPKKTLGNGRKTARHVRHDQLEPASVPRCVQPAFS